MVHGLGYDVKDLASDGSNLDSHSDDGRSRNPDGPCTGYDRSRRECDVFCCLKETESTVHPVLFQNLGNARISIIIVTVLALELTKSRESKKNQNKKRTHETTYGISCWKLVD